MTSACHLSRFRAGLAAFLLAAGVTMVADVASAQPINGRAPWCAVFSQYGGTLDCAYHSFEQCQAAASGMSNQCTTNPWYAGPPNPQPRQPRVRRDFWWW